MDIYTSGDLAFLESIWTGLGHIWSNGFLKPVLASALLLNFLSGILRWIFDQKQPIFVNFWQSILIYLIFFSTTTTVNLIKDGEAPRAIAGQFPIGFVAPASWITTAGNSIASEFKDNITAVNVGYGWTTKNFILEKGVKPLELLVRMRDERVGVGGVQKSDLLSDPDDPSNANSGLDEAMSLYFTRCVKKYLMLSESDNDSSHKVFRDRFASAIQAKSFWDNLKVDQTSWPFTYRLNGSDIESNCSDAHEEISQALNIRAEEYLKSKLLGSLHDADSSKSLLEGLDDFKEAVALISPLADGDAATNLQMNLWSMTSTFGACKDDSQLGRQYTQACQQQFTAIQNRRVTEASKFDSFREMVGPLVTFVEGFVYMITPLLLVIIMFMGGAAIKLVGKYFSALMWVILMPICQVAVDVYLNVYFNRWYYVVLNGDTAGTNLWSVASQESNWTQLESFIAFAGTAQAMVPALAMFIIFAGVHTLQGLGASASSGGSIGASTVAPDVTASTKHGVTNFSNTSTNQTRDYQGNYSGGSVSSTKALSNPNDTNIQLGQNSGVAYQKMAQEAKSQKIAAAADLDAKYQTAYETKMANDEKVDSVLAAKVGFAKTTALEAVVNQSISDQYNLGKDGSRALSKILDYKIGVDGEVSASIKTGLGGDVLSSLSEESAGNVKKALKGMGFDLKPDSELVEKQMPDGTTKTTEDTSGKPKGNASVGLQANVGAGIKGGLGGHSTEAVNDSSRETVSISNSTNTAVQDGWKEAKQMLRDWNEGHSYGSGYSDSEVVKDMNSVGGQTALKYQEAVDRSEALSQRRSEMISNTQSTGSAIASISKLDYAFGNALGNGNGFTGVNNDGKSALEVMRDKALGYFAPDASGKPGIYDADNLTQEQANHLNKEISSVEMEGLKKLGLNIGDEGFKAHAANFESDITTQARWANMSERDLYNLANYQPDAASEKAGIYESQRQMAIASIMSKVDSLSKESNVENTAELTAATGAYFSRLGELNLGQNGDAGSGRFSNLSTYGNRLTEIAEEAIISDISKTEKPDVNPSLTTNDVMDDGSQAIEKTLPKHLKGLKELDGGSADIVNNKKKELSTELEQVKENAKAHKNEIKDQLLEGGDIVFSSESENNRERVSEVSSASSAIQGQAESTYSIRRDDLTSEQNFFVRGLFNSELTQKELAMVQDPGVIERAQKAFRSLDALNDFENKYVKDIPFLKSHNREFADLVNSLPSNPQEGTGNLQKFFGSLGYNDDDAKALTSEVTYLKSQLDENYGEIKGSKSAQLNFMLIAGDRRLMDTTDPDDFKNALQRMGSSETAINYGKWHL